MIRQGRFKMITYGPNTFGDDWPVQLFDLLQDPWELNDLGKDSRFKGTIDALQQLLASVLNTTAIDERAKQVQRRLFTTYAYEKHVNASSGGLGCQELMVGILGDSFDASDAKKTAQWLGLPCPFSKSGDPACKQGILDRTGTVCCAKECGVCSHPSEACRKRPGGAHACCPSIVNKTAAACQTHAPPCIVSFGPDRVGLLHG